MLSLHNLIFSLKYNTLNKMDNGYAKLILNNFIQNKLLKIKLNHY